MSDISRDNLGQRLLAFLRERREDRGTMATLRCALVETRQRRAWPIIAAFNGIGEQHRNRVVRTIAGLYATHSKETGKGDFGATCRALLGEDERAKLAENREPGSVSKRFLHLLAAENGEIFDRVVRLALHAKAYKDEIPINYEQLFWDLWAYEAQPDQVRERWARNFWAPRSEGVGA